MPDGGSKGRASAENDDMEMTAWLPRLLWPLPGVLTGAAIGFHLYFRQPGLNTDSAAPLFFAVVWGACASMLGALCTTGIGWLIDLALRRVFHGMPLVAGGVTVACVAGLCVALYAPIESRLPTLLWPRTPQAPARPPAPGISPCKQAPPTDVKARKAWEQECR